MSTTVAEISHVSGLESEEHYEIVDGQRVELPPTGAHQSVLASSMGQIVGGHARSRRLGRVVVETLFQLRADGTLQRKPDVAFVSYTRWAKTRPVPETGAWDVIPNLSIEVNSPSNKADELLLKIADYFAAGVERVWVVYPKIKQVYVYASPSEINVLKIGDTLKGEELLAGFSLVLTELFEEVLEETSSPNGAASAG